MDIFNRPPAIAEDTLQYVIHPGPLNSNKSAVTALATLIDSYVASVIPNHIWHRDSFELKVVKTQSEWIIDGRMRVGDCVDDEWCVVWLLRDISRLWEIAISVFDSDGEFLLIEAAEQLPSWITPENSDNRVWIYKGHLHFIPLNYVSTNSTIGPHRTRSGGGSDDGLADRDYHCEYISMSDAVPIIFGGDNATLVTPDLEQAAFRRIEGYPDVARQLIHYTKAYIPQDIALALLENPGLVQKAVEAFYTRDTPQMRAAARMNRFSPNQSVLATVKMTRTAYAQLMGQRFRPPKVFGEWTEKEGQAEWRQKDIGMKIACGFEMMYQESKTRNQIHTDGPTVDETLLEARKEALQRDPEYIKYIKSLENLGYFKEELNGSAQWRDLEDRAVSPFIRSRQTDDANRTSFASLVTSAISQAQKHFCSDDTPNYAYQEEDSDDWLSVTESRIQNLLSATSQELPEKSEFKDDEMKEMASEQQATAQAEQLRGLAEKVGKFIESEGDVDGAMFEDDFLSDNADLSEFSDSDDENGSDFDTAAEKQAALDRLVPALDVSEYGIMPPSFHRNSQKVKEDIQKQEEQEKEQDLPPDAKYHAQAVRPLLFPRDQFDGVEDSDDESEDEGIAEDDGEEDQPMVVGEVEIDMKDEEEEFLKFSRDALGISEDMWKNIVQDRKDRGAFLPWSALHQQVTQNDSPMSIFEPLNSAAESLSTQNNESKVPSGTNTTLNSFEAVMQAMDAELLRVKRVEQNTGSTDKHTSERTPQKGKQKAAESNENMDVEENAAVDSSAEEVDNGNMDYTLMKNFLESFKSQQGMSGPVSNLVGRLGWLLPRDDS